MPEGAHQEEADQPPGLFKVDHLQLPGLSISSDDDLIEIAPHDVFYDKDRGLWYCDIVIEHGLSYFPFVRLSLARYQPVSIEGAHLSNIVLTDLMPLTSDRWLNVTHSRDDKIIHVAVFGNQYSDSTGHIEADEARPKVIVTDSETHETRTIYRIDIASTSIFEMWVEHLNEERGEDFGWERISDVIVERTSKPIKPVSSSPTRIEKKTPRYEIATSYPVDLSGQKMYDRIFHYTPIWAGNQILPMALDIGERYRLVIAEYEEYIVDGNALDDVTPDRKDRRLVFVEHIELT